MEIEIYFLLKQTEKNVNLMIREMPEGRESSQLQDKLTLGSQYSNSKEKDEQFASQVTFGASGIRKESFDRD